MFKDGNGTVYNGAEAKFENVIFGNFRNPGPDGISGTADDFTQTAADGIVPFTPFNFSSITGLQQKADNTVVGNMRDCGECHVGGGAMEYLPNNNSGPRISLRDAQTPAANVPGYTNGLIETVYTAFNYFIDIFGPKGDGKNPTYTAQYNDYSKTGVMEMDCLMCHLKDYKWEERKHAVRVGAFDASRSVGAGFASYSASAAPETFDGRSVVYDPSKFVFVSATTMMKLAPQVAANISGTPEAENCAACHFATEKEIYQVDWKKRGEIWMAGSEAHGALGCMGCHQRKDNIIGTSGNIGDTKLGLCDPAKGGTSPFDAMWNKLDNVGFKRCEDCHLPTDTSLDADLGLGTSYSAPNPAAAHQVLGLTAKVVQSGRDGIASKSHIELIDCTACHNRKLDFTIAKYNEDGTFRRYSTVTITGGAFVDGTGADEEGRVALHDEEAVGHDMKSSIALHWLTDSKTKKTRLYPANLLLSSFWRDMDDYGYDINADGREGGIDAILQTHIAKINKDSGLHAVMLDGIVNQAEIQLHQEKLKQSIGALNGKGEPALYPKISFMGVPFKMSHNVNAANDAWGAKGCKECHSAPGTVVLATDPDNRSGADYVAGGFYNGNYPLNGKMQELSWGLGPDSKQQVITFTRVNGGMDPSDFHPNVLTKTGDRTVAAMVVGATGFRNDFDRSELLYETTFKSLDTAWKTVITGAARPAPGQANSPWYVAGTGNSTKGWLLKIDTSDGTTVKSRTKMVSQADLTSVDALIANLNSGNNFCNNAAFEFTCYAIDTNADSINDAIEVKANDGKQIRINPATNVAPLGLGTAIYKTASASSPTGAEYKAVTNGAIYTGRAGWLSYLNSLSAASVGIGMDPVASINPISDADTGKTGTQVLVNNDVALAAKNAASAGFFTYTWQFSDEDGTVFGQNITKKFTSTGTKTIMLKVVDEEGKVSQAYQTVEVITAPSGITIDAVTIDGTTNVTFGSLPMPNAKFYVNWGDGSTQWVTTKTTTTPDGVSNKLVAHKYLTAGTKTVSITVYNSSGLKIGSKTQSITIP